MLGHDNMIRVKIVASVHYLHHNMLILHIILHHWNRNIFMLLGFCERNASIEEMKFLSLYSLIFTTSNLIFLNVLEIF